MRRIIYAFCGLVALTILFAVIGSELMFSQTAHNSPAAEAHYRRGLSLYHKLDCEGAIKEFNKAIAINPTAKYYTARGECKARSAFGNNDVTNTVERLRSVAFADLEKASELDPKYAKAYFARAMIYQRSYLTFTNTKEMNDVALAYFAKAIELDPKNADFYHGRAEFYSRVLSDHAKAGSDFDMAVRLSPDKKDYRYDRAENLAYLDNLKGAILDMSYVLAKYPKDFAARNTRADFYYKDGQYQNALADLNALLRLDPNSGITVLPERAKVYRAIGDEKRAVADEKRFSNLLNSLEKTKKTLTK